jgi:hypothetical protein
MVMAGGMSARGVFFCGRGGDRVQQIVYSIRKVKGLLRMIWTKRKLSYPLFPAAASVVARRLLHDSPHAPHLQPTSQQQQNTLSLTFSLVDTLCFSSFGSNLSVTTIGRYALSSHHSTISAPQGIATNRE